uniref:Uncharacterized protein n=1 Tax=Trichuris muris TaxID=70415 RepID=A0A5S6QQP3_TRIMR
MPALRATPKSSYDGPVVDSDRTNNFAEAAHRRIRSEFAGDHPTIWRFIDGLRKVQAGRDKEYEDYVRGEQPQPKRQRYIQADRRILAIDGSVRTTYSAMLTVVASSDPSDALQPHSEDRWAKHKSAEAHHRTTSSSAEERASSGQGGDGCGRTTSASAEERASSGQGGDGCG